MNTTLHVLLSATAIGSIVLAFVSACVLDRIVRRLYKEHPECWHSLGSPPGPFWRPPGMTFMQKIRNPRASDYYWTRLHEIRALGPAYDRMITLHLALFGASLLTLLLAPVWVVILLNR